MGLATNSSLVYSLRVWPAPTQVERLSSTPLKGRLLALPTNIRLRWKVLIRTNTLAYYSYS
jgi:hypothetical protein